MKCLRKLAARRGNVINAEVPDPEGPRRSATTSRDEEAYRGVGTRWDQIRACLASPGKLLLTRTYGAGLRFTSENVTGGDDPCLQRSGRLRPRWELSR